MVRFQTIINTAASQAVLQTSVLGILPDGSIGVISEPITIQREVRGLNDMIAMSPHIQENYLTQGNFIQGNDERVTYEMGHTPVLGMIPSEVNYSIDQDVQRLSTVQPPNPQQLHADGSAQRISNVQQPVISQGVPVQANYGDIRQQAQQEGIHLVQTSQYSDYQQVPQLPTQTAQPIQNQNTINNNVQSSSGVTPQYSELQHFQADSGQRVSTIQPPQYSDLQPQPVDNSHRVSTVQPPQFTEIPQQINNDSVHRIPNIQQNPDYSSEGIQRPPPMHANQYSELGHQMQTENMQRMSTVVPPQYSDLQKPADPHIVQNQFSDVQQHVHGSEGGQRMSTVQPPHYAEQQQIPNETMQRMSTVQPPVYSEIQQTLQSDSQGRLSTVQVPQLSNDPHRMSTVQQPQFNDVQHQLSAESSQHASPVQQQYSEVPQVPLVDVQRVSTVQPPKFSDLQQQLQIDSQRMSTVQPPHYADLQSHQHPEIGLQQAPITHPQQYVQSDNGQRMSTVIPPQSDQLQNINNNVQQRQVDSVQRISTVSQPQYSEMPYQMQADTAQRISSVHQPQFSELQQQMPDNTHRVSTVQPPQFSDLQQHLPTEKTQRVSTVQPPQYSNSQQPIDSVPRVSTVQPPQFSDLQQALPTEMPRVSTVQPPQFSDLQQALVTETSRVSTVQPPQYSELQQPINVDNPRVSTIQPPQYSELQQSMNNTMHQQYPSDNSHRVSTVQPPQYSEIKTQLPSVQQQQQQQQPIPQQLPIQQQQPIQQQHQQQQQQHSHQQQYSNVNQQTIQGLPAMQAQQYSSTQPQPAGIQQVDNSQRVSTVQPPQFSDLQKQLPVDNHRVSTVQPPHYSDLQQKLPSEIPHRMSTVHPPQYTELQQRATQSLGHSDHLQMPTLPQVPQQIISQNQQFDSSRGLASQVHPASAHQVTHMMPQQLSSQYEQQPQQQMDNIHRMSTAQPPNIQQTTVQNDGGISNDPHRISSVNPLQTHLLQDSQHTVPSNQGHYMPDNKSQVGATQLQSQNQTTIQGQHPMQPQHVAQHEQHRMSTIEGPNIAAQMQVNQQDPQQWVSTVPNQANDVPQDALHGMSMTHPQMNSEGQTVTQSYQGLLSYPTSQAPTLPSTGQPVQTNTQIYVDHSQGIIQNVESYAHRVSTVQPPQVNLQLFPPGQKSEGGSISAVVTPQVPHHFPENQGLAVPQDIQQSHSQPMTPQVPYDSQQQRISTSHTFSYDSPHNQPTVIPQSVHQVSLQPPASGQVQPPPVSQYENHSYQDIPQPGAQPTQSVGTVPGQTSMAPPPQPKIESHPSDLQALEAELHKLSTGHPPSHSLEPSSRPSTVLPPQMLQVPLNMDGLQKAVSAETTPLPEVNRVDSASSSGVPTPQNPDLPPLSGQTATTLPNVPVSP